MVKPPLVGTLKSLMTSQAVIPPCTCVCGWGGVWGGCAPTHKVSHDLEVTEEPRTSWGQVTILSSWPGASLVGTGRSQFLGQFFLCVVFHPAPLVSDLPLPGRSVWGGHHLGPPAAPATMPGFMWSTKGLERILGERPPPREVGLATDCCGDFKSPVCAGRAGGSPLSTAWEWRRAFLHL